MVKITSFTVDKICLQLKGLQKVGENHIGSSNPVFSSNTNSVPLLCRKPFEHLVDPGSRCSVFTAALVTTDHLENCPSYNLEWFPNECFLRAVG